MPSAWDRVATRAVHAVDRADKLAIEGVYAAVSVPAERTRQRLRLRGWSFLDDQDSTVGAPELRHTAERLVGDAAGRATTLGGFAGLGGLASVPPEIAAQIVALVRLAQRLAVVYGFDPETERGRLAVQQALSAGLEIDLPQGGPLGLRLSDLPRVLAPRAPRDASVAMTRAVVRSTAWLVVGRFGRFVPVLSAGFGAVAGRRRVRRVGHRMIDVLERLCDRPIDARVDVVDAIEVTSP